MPAEKHSSHAAANEHVEPEVIQVQKMWVDPITHYSDPSSLSWVLQMDQSKYLLLLTVPRFKTPMALFQNRIPDPIPSNGFSLFSPLELAYVGV